MKHFTLAAVSAAIGLVVILAADGPPAIVHDLNQGTTTAVVTQMSGRVRAISPLPLRSGTLLAPGAFIALSDSSDEVVVICADQSVVRLTGKIRWRVDPRDCAADGDRGSTGQLEQVLRSAGYPAPERHFNFWGAVASTARGGRVEYEEDARQRRIYPEGTMFVPEGAGARVGVLCSNDFVVRQAAPEWQLGAEACASDGSQIPAGSYSELARFNRITATVSHPSADLLLEPRMMSPGPPGPIDGCRTMIQVFEREVLDPRPVDSELRPLQVQMATSIVFVNGLCAAIRLSSMDSDGNWVERAEVPSDGRTDFLEAWVTQPWRVDVDSNAPRPGRPVWTPMAIFLAGENDATMALITCELNVARRFCLD